MFYSWFLVIFYPKTSRDSGTDVFLWILQNFPSYDYANTDNELFAITTVGFSISQLQ